MNPISLTANDFFDPVNFQVAYLNQIPHPKQIEVLRSPNKHKIIVCGRRSGKTQMIAGEIIRGGILGLYMKQSVVGLQYKHVLIVFNKILELMKKAKVFDDIKQVVKAPYPKIIFANDSFVDFGSADNPDSLRGEGYDRQFKDESAFIKEGAKFAIRPLMYDSGGPIWETTTPWGKGEVWDLWARGLNGDEDYGCFHYNYLDNPYLSDEGVIEIEKDIAEYGEDSLYVQCEIFGNFAEDRDTYFKKEVIEGCIEEYNIPEIPHPKYNYYLGVDIAGEGEDESVFITLLGQGLDVRVVDIDNFIKNKPREIVGMCKILDKQWHYSNIRLDKTGMGEGPSDWLRETLSTGGEDDYRVEGVRFTTQTKQDMYSNLKKLMGQKRIKFPRHKKLIYQLLDLRFETMSSGELKIHHSNKGHDDYCDALALACWAFKEEEAGYIPTIA